MSQGYVRVTDDRMHPDAVQWWFWWQKEGWAFARGGRCRTIREARKMIRAAYGEMQREHHAFLHRPVGELLADGSIREFERSPYEGVPS